MEDKKKAAALKAVEWIQDGMVLGLGTGSTTFYALEAIGKMVAKGYDLVGIPTSTSTENLADKFGIPLTTLDEVESIDLTIDGADEVDPEKRLIKGMGGALLREKIVASVSEVEIIVVDDSKLVDLLGTKSMLPVEVVPFGHMRVKDRIEATGCQAHLRGEKTPYSTDSGNYIYDCRYESIESPEELEQELDSIPGVVENGLFLGLASKIIIAGKGGIQIRD
ncbi:MAG: ribose-5-phosphate isomerase RpiA [Methanomassiliicoccales archaeon]|nr:ribose-5-phosphate isomerase RpiA [Methanomassiliicoccales archaeon]NYT16081.1 ribose-5-phosphate isomerase RpiA [Methanomassiliicoccales archaeon]